MQLPARCLTRRAPGNRIQKILASGWLQFGFWLCNYATTPSKDFKGGTNPLLRSVKYHYFHRIREGFARQACLVLPRPPKALAATSANHTRVLRDTRGLRRRWRLRFQRSRLSVRWRGFASPAAAYQGGGGSVFKEAAYQYAGEASHLRRPLIRAARRGFHA